MSTTTPNALLAINSLDRYILGAPNGPQATAYALYGEYLNYQPYCNNFQIQSPGALIYGYMTKLIVAHVQMTYNIPTVVPGRNDSFWIYGVSTGEYYFITIPYGFYTPLELAAVLQTAILTTDISIQAPEFTVTYNITNGANGGFEFRSNNGFQFTFPNVIVDYIDIPGLIGPDDPLITSALKAYKLMGISVFNVQPGTQQVSQSALTWLYTQFIDIISETLTKYQNIKDTDTSAQKLNSIVNRVYLSQGTPNQLANIPLGSSPFTVVQDMNSPKVIRWNRDEAVNSLDFQLRDQYGDLIFFSNFQNNQFEQTFYNTEFQMTVLCTEGERY